MSDNFSKLCIDLEHFETPQWPLDKILDREIMTNFVIDPCTGSGIMTKSAREKGYFVMAIDVHDWGYPQTHIANFLNIQRHLLPFPDDGDLTIFMNPPFSKTCEFVEKAFELGARKIVMFQRWAFRESSGRREFFKKYPMARMYLCADRCPSWRHDIQPDEKGIRYNPETGKKMSSSPTPYGFFVWEKGQEQSNPPCFSLYK